MIRFVGIDKKWDVIFEQRCFAFFNTVTDNFVNIYGEHVFEDIKDLEEAFYLDDTDKTYQSRLKRLIPDDWKYMEDS